MKICYTSDLHSKPSLYRQLADLIEREQPEVLLFGGDQCTTRLTPDALDVQRNWLRGPFHDFLKRVRPISRVYWASGNHDLAGALDVLSGMPDLIANLDMCLTDIGDGWSAYSFPYGPISRAWYYKDWERQDTDQPPPKDPSAMYRITLNGQMEAVDAGTVYRDWPSLSDLLAEVPHTDRLLLIAHYPPRSTPLDASAFGRNAGSRSLADYLERSRIPFTFHGHIHESPYMTGRWAARIGGSFSINAGQIGSRLHAVMVDTEDIENSLRHTLFGSAAQEVPRRRAWSLRWAMYREWRREGLVPPLYRVALRSLFRRLRRLVR